MMPAHGAAPLSCLIRQSIPQKGWLFYFNGKILGTRYFIGSVVDHSTVLALFS